MVTGSGQGSPARDSRPSPRDTWWFSPMLRFVAGGAIVGFQWGPISTGTANWLNWLVAVAGVVVAIAGARAWLLARPRA